MSTHPLERSRQIRERWVIEGDLVLQTPTHLGNGDTDGVVDMPLLLDEATGKALLPGTSLAGALRNYLRERRHGFGQRQPDAAIEALFGGDKGDDKGSQSSLIVDDALGERPRVELRDGVRIDPVTRTAKIDFENGKARGYKYDLQLLEAGTRFPLRMELLVSGNEQELKQTLALALDGLAKGEIAIGLRKRRGFGECRVTEWRVRRYELEQPADLLAWLTEDHADWGYATENRVKAGGSVADLLGVTLDAQDKRQLCKIHASLFSTVRCSFGPASASRTAAPTRCTFTAPGRTASANRCCPAPAWPARCVTGLSASFAPWMIRVALRRWWTISLAHRRSPATSARPGQAALLSRKR
jgi:CRISPR/Cas system CSM-associated protein Csm3 (group 7 of RAMP superfamily)